MSFKVIPSNFIDSIDHINVVQMKQVPSADKKKQKFTITTTLTVNRDLSSPVSDSKETMLTMLDAENQYGHHQYEHRLFDPVDDKFSEIQIQDMEQEKFTDKKVKEVVKSQQKAMREPNS